jgi:hypothetical protein
MIVKQCIKKAGEDEVKVKACEPTLKAAEALK